MDTLYCDNCKFLNPKEYEQPKAKEPHMCLLYDRPVFHYGEHPRLPKPDYCAITIEAKNET